MPSDRSLLLDLPYIQPGQAQKHVTHNEALRRLDLLVQLAVASRQTSAPPPGATPGLRLIVPETATGAFAGHVNQIALCEVTGWSFHVPEPGWSAELLDEGLRVVFDGTGWRDESEATHLFAALGIATSADATNRLAVAAPATLLTHAGQGHQLKINKASPGDTASLLFQTDWSGRAEMGTTGSDGFAIKVSSDGSSFHTALSAAPSTGRVTFGQGASLPDGALAAPALAFQADEDTGFIRTGNDQMALVTGGQRRVTCGPSGLEIDLPVSGTGVAQSRSDVTLGRLARLGDAGLAVPLTASSTADFATVLTTGFMHNPSTVNVPADLPLAGRCFYGLSMTSAGHARGAQFLVSHMADRVYLRGRTDNVWDAGWNELLTRLRIIGTVSQSAGQATGEILERGSNANGSWTRLADGLQICRGRRSLINTADVTWTYPAAFASAPSVTGIGAGNVDRLITIGGTGEAGLTSVELRGWTMASAPSRSTTPAEVVAIGRWY